MNLEQWMADFTIDNNGSLEELHANIKRLSTRLFKKYMPTYD
jgi:dephospho-CoA kinase